MEAILIVLHLTTRHGDKIWVNWLNVTSFSASREVTTIRLTDSTTLIVIDTPNSILAQIPAQGERP